MGPAITYSECYAQVFLGDCLELYKNIEQNEIQIKVSKNSPTGQSEILTPGDIGTSGVDGETIKIITKEEEQWNQVNPSCLLAYLGIRGFANIVESNLKNVFKNALPILAYYDIFKNFYANTQEDNFYISGTSAQLSEIQRVVGGNVTKG